MSETVTTGTAWSVRLTLTYTHKRKLCVTADLFRHTQSRARRVDTQSWKECGRPDMCAQLEKNLLTLLGNLTPRVGGTLPILRGKGLHLCISAQVGAFWFLTRAGSMPARMIVDQVLGDGSAVC